MKIGIYGGSFLPIHIGHLIMADFFLHQFQLDFVYFVPNYKSPLKDYEYNLDRVHIINLISLSINDNKCFKLETFEINQKKINYSIETVNYFKEKYYNSELFFLIGYDQFLQFDKWYMWEEILNNVNLVVAPRNLMFKENNGLDFKKFDNYKKKIAFLNAPLIDISSSIIRDNIKNKKPFKYLLHPSAYEYIINNNIFQ